MLYPLQARRSIRLHASDTSPYTHIYSLSLSLFGSMERLRSDPIGKGGARHSLQFSLASPNELSDAFLMKSEVNKPSSARFFHAFYFGFLLLLFFFASPKRFGWTLTFILFHFLLTPPRNSIFFAMLWVALTAVAHLVVRPHTLFCRNTTTHTQTSKKNETRKDELVYTEKEGKKRCLV